MRILIFSVEKIINNLEEKGIDRTKRVRKILYNEALGLFIYFVQCGRFRSPLSIFFRFNLLFLTKYL